MTNGLSITSASPGDEVEITYSDAALVEKIRSYALNPHALPSGLRVNLAKLKQFEVSEKITINSALVPLHNALLQWAPSHDVASLTAQINHLVYLWLTAIQNGVSIQNVLNLVKCLELKSGLITSSSLKLHLFLYDLIAESTHMHQHLTLDYILNFDANTRLPSTNLILKDIETAVSHADERQLIGLFSLHFQTARNNLKFSKIIILDLNRQIATILRQHIADDCQLYCGGDAQFDILIPKLRSVTQLNLLAAKISRAFEQLLFFTHQSILMTPFIGCSFLQAGSHDIQALYDNSKIALESAITKQQPFVIYSDALKEQLQLQNALEIKVLEAFGSDNLTLFFQPIIDLKNSKCTGAELLLRWSEQFGYSVYPSLIIDILNKVGKGKMFTRWLVNSACRYMSELTRVHQLDVYLTINLRAEDLYDIELPHLLSNAVSLWKINSRNIVLEITENGILEYTENSNSVIDQLAKEGFRFALDDFGTGFSSLSRLRTMPIDLIKIDQSFVRNIPYSKDDFEIVQSVAMLAKSLGKEVLAEGVEDEACLNLIKKLEIDKCQGYFYAKPMAYEHFIEWAKAH